MSMKYCPSCGASLDLSARECKYCGEAIAAAPQQPQAPQYQAQPQYQQPQGPQYQAIPQGTPPIGQPMYATGAPVKTKSKTTAGILAILLGGLGVHKFYLGKIGLGILYILFCWTYIPAIVGLIEGIIYLTQSDEDFYRKHVK
ncbi:zinc-ribbon domain-containing protein [Proteiniborus ethanoligenes]|uniref:Zinc-ribbon domain-containing protein n=1 Tax=Proteiniborus ethanoligenes TaxID=415015 RepID=A0A1H3Q3T5_9FIRM|nr:TM2 domain-containing protein [Proteiniborus ethanoligenes]TAH63851.1 MAG: TM2 domain-containing protein [Gottschalkiaceae bacterium]SDZ07913.1 zinc-ribbon domain-containing protein [Proteiniborus ethanoligenes]